MARNNRIRSSSTSRGGFGRKLLLSLLLVVALGLIAGAFMLLETEAPIVTIGGDPQFIGASVAIPLEVSDKRSGIRNIRMVLLQEEKEYILLDRQFERQAWLKKAGPATHSETVAVATSGTDLKDGDAQLVVTVHDFSLLGFLKGNTAEVRKSVQIDTKPPVITVEHAQLYIRPGGSGMVLYSLSEPAVRHGVQVDKHFYPGFSLEEGSKSQIAYIGLPWDAKRPEQSRVIAQDQAGNEGFAAFAMNFKPVPDKKDKLNVGDGFLNSKIPEFEAHYPEMSGSPIEKYLYANRNVRQQNSEAITNLCANPEPQQLWQDKFLRMPGANKAGYADQRTYYYKGEAVDNQTHLGIDIASVERAEIRAGNRGKVIYADYLGIYGNMVLLDHGQGLFSLYSHLSSIETTLGKLVEKDELIGRSGATGMAGGDHLHFSVLVHGIFVNPIEWWDQHWIDVNIADIIGKR